MIPYLEITNTLCLTYFIGLLVHYIGKIILQLISRKEVR